MASFQSYFHHLLTESLRVTLFGFIHQVFLRKQGKEVSFTEAVLLCVLECRFPKDFHESLTQVPDGTVLETSSNSDDGGCSRSQNVQGKTSTNCDCDFENDDKDEVRSVKEEVSNKESSTANASVASASLDSDVSKQARDNENDQGPQVEEQSNEVSFTNKCSVDEKPKSAHSDKYDSKEERV